MSLADPEGLDAKALRLLRRKGRLTNRLREIDLAATGAGREPPRATLLRARIYRCDLLLERAGAL